MTIKELSIKTEITNEHPSTEYFYINKNELEKLQFTIEDWSPTTNEKSKIEKFKNITFKSKKLWENVVKGDEDCIGNKMKGEFKIKIIYQIQYKDNSKIYISRVWKMIAKEMQTIRPLEENEEIYFKMRALKINDNYHVSSVEIESDF